MDHHNGEVNIHRAYGLASEAIQALRSHERVTALQLEILNKQHEGLNNDVAEKHEEIKKLIADNCEKMERGFRSYDQKFWSLAVALIGILLTICGFLIAYTLFPGVRGH